MTFERASQNHPAREYKGFSLQIRGSESGWYVRGCRSDGGLFTLSLCGKPREYFDTLPYESFGEALREAQNAVDISVRPYPYA
jgi:hypothetical protein